MTTVVNNPAPVQESGGNSFMIGIVLIIGFVGILLYFGLPALKRTGPAQTPQINVTTPQVVVPTTQAPQIVIPDKIDVNVTQGK